MPRTLLYASLIYLGLVTATMAQNPYFFESTLHGYPGPNIVITYGSTSIQCAHGGVRADRQDVGFCYSGNQHDRTVVFSGSAVFVHSRYGVVSCQTIPESSQTVLTPGDVAWTQVTATCWEMICDASSCGQYAKNANDYWSATVMRQSGGGTFRPSGVPAVNFVSADAFVQLYECYYGDMGGATVSCYSGDTLTHQIKFSGPYFEIHDIEKQTMVMYCDDNPASRYRDTDPSGAVWNKTVADCHWSGSNIDVKGTLGKR